MKNLPLISVILTSFDHGRFIREAIESVLNQTFRDIELIIWDDASVDDSWEIIQSYDDSRIRAFKNLQNKGPSFGVNKAIFELAQSKYIAIHHSDDLFLPQKLEKQVAFLESHPEFGAVFSQAEIINEEGAPFTDSGHFYSSIFRQKNRTRFEWLRHFFFHGNCLCHPSVLARRSVYLNTGLYDRRLGQLPDFDMWIRMCLQYEIHILDEPLVKFRVRAGEANQSGHKAETMVRGRNELLHVSRNFSKIESEQELHLVFPKIRDRFPVGTPVSYQLAMLALESDVDATQVFGLELLYALMADESRATELEQYGFSYMDLVALSGRCDFSRNTDLFRAEAAYGVQQLELQRVKNSISWRVTGPLRVFANLWGHLQNWWVRTI